MKVDKRIRLTDDMIRGMVGAPTHARVSHVNVEHATEEDERLVVIEWTADEPSPLIAPIVPEVTPVVPEVTPEVAEVVRCAFVPPTPGYAACTRRAGHDGPCAHRILECGAECAGGVCTLNAGHDGDCVHEIDFF